MPSGSLEIPTGDEDGPIYEVERILAKRLNEEGIPLFLVKWKGYDDKMCTWEPFESFIQKDVLEEWKVQEEKGDVLNAEELERVQREMDNFTARNAVSDLVDESGGTHMDKVDAGGRKNRARIEDVGSDGHLLERPSKCQKLVGNSCKS